MNPEKKYNCTYCKYSTNTPSDWLKHIASKKHIRKGEKIIHKCTKCIYECRSLWNFKLHYLSQHATKEERSKSKYYCDICDQVFFSPLYLVKHNNGIRHKNIVLIDNYNKLEANNI
jgi:hypothetical protein